LRLLSATLLLCPSTLLLSLASILSIVNFEPLHFSLVAILAINIICLWIITFQQRRDPAVQLTKKLWFGLGLSPIASASYLVIYNDETFGRLSQMYFFSLAPTAYACICAYLAFRAKTTMGSNSGETSQRLPLRRKALLLASYACTALLALFILIGMADTLLTLGYSAVGELLSPLNVLNWTFILILAIPGIALRKLAHRKTQPRRAV